MTLEPHGNCHEMGLLLTSKGDLAGIHRTMATPSRRRATPNQVGAYSATGRGIHGLWGWTSRTRMAGKTSSGGNSTRSIETSRGIL